jgi:hypothetical protein
MPQTITVPPASDQTLRPSNSTFEFVVTQACNVCFAEPSVANTFQQLAGQTFQWSPAGSPYGPYPIPSVTNASIEYNTSPQGTICKPTGIILTGHVIVVGTGIVGKKPTKKKAKKAPAKKKAPPKKKAATKKGGSKSAAKRKPAKKAAKKAVRKPAKKSAKKAAKKKSARKSRR